MPCASCGHASTKQSDKEKSNDERTNAWRDLHMRKTPDAGLRTCADHVGLEEGALEQNVVVAQRLLHQGQLSDCTVTL